MHYCRYYSLKTLKCNKKWKLDTINNLILFASIGNEIVDMYLCCTNMLGDIVYLYCGMNSCCMIHVQIQVETRGVNGT